MHFSGGLEVAAVPLVWGHEMNYSDYYNPSYFAITYRFTLLKCVCAHVRLLAKKAKCLLLRKSYLIQKTDYKAETLDSAEHFLGANRYEGHYERPKEPQVTFKQSHSPPGKGRRTQWIMIGEELSMGVPVSCMMTIAFMNLPSCS